MPAIQSLLCDPSQNEPFPECLQPHQATVFASVMSTLAGPSPEPLCEPSQNGWPLDLPQAQKKYVPGSTFWTKGPFCAIIFSLIQVIGGIYCLP
jgi:hypothetical protein